MGKIYQFHTAFAACYASILMGLLTVWPAYTIPVYQEDNTLLSAPITELQSSLLGSMPMLGAMIGTAIAGPVVDRVGRKKGGLILFFPFALCWAAIKFSYSILVILIARFVGGMPCGSCTIYGAMYISEVAEDSIRGTLTSGSLLFFCVGSLVSYLLGWFLSYHTILWVNLAASVAYLLLLMTLVESPVYLLKNNREEEARAALAHYRGSSPDSKHVLEEFTRLKQQLTPAVEMVSITDDYEKGEQAEKEKLNTQNDDYFEEKKKMPSWKLLFVSPSSRNALIVVGVVFLSQVFMGAAPVQVYAKVLFTKAAPDISSHMCSVLFTVVLFCGSLVTTLAADKAGRRVLMISSSIMVALSMASLGFLMQTSIAPTWVSALVLLLYCFCFFFGVGSVPFVLLAEVFAPEVKGLASMLIIETVFFLNFLVLGVFPYMTESFGMHGVFYIFATVAAANAVYSFFMIPETKGLSTQQIQELFLRRRV